MKLGPEYYESICLADWLERQNVLFTHFPAGETRGDHRTKIYKGKLIRYSPTGQKLTRMGLRPGVSDYLIFDPPPTEPDFVGTVLELKALQKDGGNPPTEDQLAFLQDMEKRRWAAAWFYGWEAAVEWLKELGYERRGMRISV